MNQMEITGIRLVREGDQSKVYAEINNTWIEVISEYYDAPFSHYVTTTGIINKAKS